MIYSGFILILRKIMGSYDVCVMHKEIITKEVFAKNRARKRVF